MSTSKTKSANRKEALSGSSASDGGTGFWSWVAIFGGIGAAAYFSKDSIKAFFTGRAEDRSLVEGTPESVARKMRSAMGYTSTDEDELYRIANEEIPSKAFWQQVIAAYRTLYGNSLVDDLDGASFGLDSGEFAIFMGIINRKN